MYPIALLVFTLTAAPPAPTPFADALRAIDATTFTADDAKASHRNHGPWFKALMVANVAVLSADCGGTMAALETGRVHEANPPQRWLIEKLNDPTLACLVNGGLSGLALLAADKFSQKHPKAANAMLGFWATFRGHTALKNNREVYKRAKARQ